MDYKEELLVSLFIEYKGKFEWLNQTIGAGNFTEEYARGGCTVHCGFYCPSPVIDIIIGGSDRGHLVQRNRSNKPFDYVYMKAGDKLRIVDTYAEFYNVYHHYQREFLIDNGEIIVAPTYSMTSEKHDLEFFSICHYDSAGRILQYLTLSPSCSLMMGSQNVTDAKDCLIYGEQYSYDDETGLLESVVSGQKMNDYLSEYSYRFFHPITPKKYFLKYTTIFNGCQVVI